MQMPAKFALLGTLTGAVAAATVFVPAGETPAMEIFGRCVGVRIFNECGGFNTSFYVAPGLIFGITFGAYLHRVEMLRTRAAGLFTVAAVLANAIAVASALLVMDFLADRAGSFPALLVAGSAAGTIGGGLLALCAAQLGLVDRWLTLTLSGAGLGVLLALWDWSLGEPIFISPGKPDTPQRWPRCCRGRLAIRPSALGSAAQ